MGGHDHNYIPVLIEPRIVTSNLRRGQPGYGKHLDRDGDGVACE